MVNELSLNQTVQGEVGEFNTLYVNGVEVTTDGSGDFTGDVTIAGTLTVEGRSYFNTKVEINAGLDVTSLATFSRFIDCKSNVRATDVRSGKWSGNSFTQDYSLDDIGKRVDALEAASFDATPIYDRLEALEAPSNTSPDVDDLSTNVQALQTRIGTLESLIGLLTNNNTNDTGIEHRLTRIEKAITAIKAIHDANKSVYNIPVDW